MSAPPKTVHRKKYVLIVDDEAPIVDTLAVILRRSGYDAVPAYDAMTALLLCRTNCPDLVISDVMMPAMNGIEMAIQVQESCRECKILLFSGMAASADLLEAARQGGHEFELVSKPIHPADLLLRLSAAGVRP